MARKQFTISHSGMGGFLNPPGHAEHDYSVNEYNTSGRVVGSMSLRSALESLYMPEDIKTRCRELLSTHPGEFTPEWEASVYAYFRGCYSPDGVNRNVSDFVHEGPAEHHLAYMFVRAFFPDAKPNFELIANAPQWGKSA